ncbi:MAG TPA: ABC transporter permease, partial [Gemmataceae bacterium]|nr:ABC transporter permease [Gemmataceae bacterium]
WLLAELILLTMVLLVPAFHRPGYWLQLGPLYFAVAALALAETPVMLTGGIDLSIGSVTVFASVVIGALWHDLGLPIGWAVAGGVLAGLLAGISNGVLVNAGVMPLVATLATRELFRGLALTLSGDTAVSRFPPILRTVWHSAPLGVPLPVLVLALLFVVTYLVVHHTWLGRMVYAIGDNERAARFAGVPVQRVKLGLYTGCGLVAGVCGASLVMKYGAAKADAEPVLDLLAIACVVMGGIRIVGGAGNVAGTLLGTVTVVALLAGMGSIASAWRDTLTGAVLVVVAVVNEAAARWSQITSRKGLKTPSKTEA